MPEVVFITRVLAHYRVPFHEAVRAQLAASGVNYRLLYGMPRSGESSKGDSTTISWAEPITNSYFGPHDKLVWQPVLRAVASADLVVIGQENALLSNYLLHAWRFIGGPRLALFGHGRNFQSSKPNGVAERFKRLWIRQADWWFAYTGRSAAIVLATGFPRDRITVVNNAIGTSDIAGEIAALDPLQQAALRQSLVGGSNNVGIFVGGLYPQKRLRFLLDAAQLVRSWVPDFHLLVVGGGPDAAIAEAATAELPWVHYLGPKFGAEKTALASLGRVFLMPGLVGLGVLDSFAYGTPMVTTNFPYHSPEIDYLEHGRNGLMAADDVRSYADAVLAVLTDEALRLSLRQGALDALATYTIEAMVQRFAGGILQCLRFGR